MISILGFLAGAQGSYRAPVRAAPFDDGYGAVRMSSSGVLTAGRRSEQIQLFSTEMRVCWLLSEALNDLATLKRASRRVFRL
jgi:hypothetical protein